MRSGSILQRRSARLQCQTSCRRIPLLAGCGSRAVRLEVWASSEFGMHPSRHESFTGFAAGCGCSLAPLLAGPCSPLAWVKRCASPASHWRVGSANQSLCFTGALRTSARPVYSDAYEGLLRSFWARSGVSGRAILVTAVRKEGLPSESQRCPSHRVHSPGSAGFRWRRKALQKRSVDSFARHA